LNTPWVAYNYAVLLKKGMKKLLKRFVIFFTLAIIFVTLTTCTYTWRATPSNSGSINLCKPHRTQPQMIKIPMFSQTWQIVEDCDVFNREKVGIALLVFYNAWRLKFGDRNGQVWSSLNDLMIEWSGKYRKIPSAFSMDGRPVTDVRISGLALTKTMIWVYVGQNEKICETSFVHELVHIAIWKLKKTDGDPDHLGKKYSGWSMNHNILIQDVNAMLCELGL